MTDERYVLERVSVDWPTVLDRPMPCTPYLRLSDELGHHMRRDYVRHGYVPLAAGTREACEAAKRLMEMEP